jgi:hypothetical protein
MVDFQTLTRTIRIADSEDRALLGSNPSAAVGDGDISRSFGPTEAPAPRHFFLAVLVQKSDKPIIIRHHSTVVKTRPVTRPVCHLAISLERRSRNQGWIYKH